jgi:hypothetical protein
VDDVPLGFVFREVIIVLMGGKEIIKVRGMTLVDG